MLLRRSTDIYPKELARDMREFFNSLLGEAVCSIDFPADLRSCDNVGIRERTIRRPCLLGIPSGPGLWIAGDCVGLFSRLE